MCLVCEKCGEVIYQCYSGRIRDCPELELCENCDKCRKNNI